MAQRSLDPNGGPARLVTARMTPDMVQKLDALAERTGRTRSDVMRDALADVIDAAEHNTAA